MNDEKEYRVKNPQSQFSNLGRSIRYSLKTLLELVGTGNHLATDIEKLAVIHKY